MRISKYNDLLICFKDFSCFKEIHSATYLSKHHIWRRGNHKIILEDYLREILLPSDILDNLVQAQKVVLFLLASSFCRAML